MKLIDLANVIWSSELLETTDTTVSKIVFWLSSDNNIGILNDLLGTNYSISGNDATPELDEEAAAIYSTFYLYKYYQRLMKTNLNATQYDWSEISEADSTVRRVSKNEIAKNYRLLANDTKDYLDKLVESYKKFHCIPASLHSSYFTSTIYQKTLQQPT